MDPKYAELLSIINLSTGMSQAHAEHMIRALIEKGWTICPVDQLKESAR